MKSILKSYALFFLLIVTVYTASAQLQEIPDALAKTTLQDNGYDYPFKDGQNSLAKVTVPIIEHDSTLSPIDYRYAAAVDRLQQQGSSILEYAKANNFNTEYCFLVDMSIPSGKRRFFIYNMGNESLENSSLVAHGFGSAKPNANDPLVFSNTPNSFKTSLGKYKIGNSYFGTYGLAYRLYGLDSTNSNAYKRAIVLHSEIHVPESETYPYIICESAGCPMVNPSFLAILDTYIKSSKKPILLWIYN